LSQGAVKAASDETGKVSVGRMDIVTVSLRRRGFDKEGELVMRGPEPGLPRLFGGERVVGAAKTGIGGRGRRFVVPGGEEGRGEATHGTGRTTGRTATS